ncbi:putative Transcription factor [Zostera marina]|uniref:Putative Transcription factor n=1 Tax=Zostera marina TaxID=29655 RepID=A0A0K9P2P1_ZOSMR|nr:putative Transcription factor [Zostera marina]
MDYSDSDLQKKQQQVVENQPIPYGLLVQQPPSSSLTDTFMNKESSAAYDLGDLDKALFLYLDGQEQKQTLNIFPSLPMHEEPSSSSKGGGTELASPSTSSSTKVSSDKTMELGNRNYMTTSDLPSTAGASDSKDPKSQVKRETSPIKPGASRSDQVRSPRISDSKTLRRLAQNREAARKSRLRKKAYVQQLESSRIKLTQIEQELQRARSHSQGSYYGGGGGASFSDHGVPSGIGGISSEAAMFDMEYGRWSEEHHRLMCELRAAMQEPLGDNELRIYVDNCLVHHDEMITLKSIAIKTDVFHLISGTWKSPAERCFLWMGDFRPSDIIKIVLRHIEPLTEQQLVVMCNLQQSTHEAEEVFTQSLEALHRSLADTIVSDELNSSSNMTVYMNHMALAVNKLSSLENFIRQADSLRQQTLHRLHQILTIRQAARGYLAMGEYFHRFRALSSLWLARPRQE